MNVNAALGLITQCKARIRSLETLRNQVSIRERFYEATTREKEPVYSVQEVDKMLTQLNKLQYQLETAVKKSNAVTEIEFSGSTDVIFEQLK